MKVWIGYRCYYNFADTFKHVEKVFDDEVKALLWVEDKEFTTHHNPDYDWREYVAYEVE